ncbi:hypothetical protein NDU88_000426 [Pleurodeles waltl]|uniref:Secreted protein n=1 Tax=Pleurodeles waltl TaxID=8319 RepID=A0AAV7NCN9_PLEWA|nr:hypothetical protein NDU88_000426 [Pleurodeles waltl]
MLHIARMTLAAAPQCTGTLLSQVEDLVLGVRVGVDSEVLLLNNFAATGGGRLDAIITRRLVSALLRSSVGCLRVFVVYVSASRLRGVTAACGGHSWSFVSFSGSQLRGFRVSEGRGSTSGE